MCDTLKLRPKGHYLFVGRLVRDIAYLESQWLSAVSEGEAVQNQVLCQVEMSGQNALV